jgi:transcriptional regulator with XRE-family HTH domain
VAVPEGFDAELGQLLAAFGKNARALRERIDVSQEELAQLAGIHRTEVGAIERGEREPRLSMLLIVARGLGVAPAELLHGLHAPEHRRGSTHSKAR